MATRRRCLNCETELRGEYCSACGQRDLASRLAIGELIREILSETFELDGRVWRTLIPFLFKPGALTHEYIAGRRVRYTSPFRLFLATTLLWLTTSLIAEQLHDFEADAADSDISVSIPTEDEDDSAMGEWLREHGAQLEELSEAELAQLFWHTARETLPKSALLTIPVFALLMKLLFIRQDRYYVEHLVFALHVHAFVFFILAIGVLFEHDTVANVLSLVLLAYTYVALWRAYDARWWTSALRLAALLFVHSIVLLLATMLMVLASMLLG